MEQPSIYPFGLRIDQPVTTLTDLIVAIVCFYAFFKLTDYHVDHRIYILARAYFLFMGIATFIGAIVGHGFLYALSPSWKILGWGFGMIAINVMERVMINYSKPLMSHKVANFFSKFNIVELFVFAGLAYGNLVFEWFDIDSFRFVEIHSGYGLIVFVMGFGMFNHLKRREDDDSDILMFIWAVGATTIASLFFMSKVGIDKWYNHVDISHTLMALAAYLFYIGFTKILTRIKNGKLDIDSEWADKGQINSEL